MICKNNLIRKMAIVGTDGIKTGLSEGGIKRGGGGGLIAVFLNKRMKTAFISKISAF
jgi:hypothetical protein